MGYKKRLRRAEVCSPLWLGTWKWSGSGAAEPRFYNCNQTQVKLEMTGILISSHLQRNSSLHGNRMKHKAFYDMRISLPQLISQSDPQRSEERSDDVDWNSQFEMFGILLQTLYFNIFFFFFLPRRPFSQHGSWMWAGLWAEMFSRWGSVFMSRQRLLLHGIISGRLCIGMTMQRKRTERAKEVSFDHRAGRLIRREENGRGNQVLMFPTLPGRRTLGDFTQKH